MNVLLSRSFAVCLLVVMLAFLVAGSLVPDLDSMTDAELARIMKDSPLMYRISDALRVQQIMSSPFFFILPALIFLSTAACTFRRLSRRGRKEGGFAYQATRPTTLDVRELTSLLAEEKWRVTRNRDSLTADKGGFGFWGSIVFHAGLLLVFVAVVISALTRFNAELLLTEGFPVQLEKNAFVRIYKSKGLSRLPPARIELTKFIPSYEKDFFQKDFAAVLSIDGAMREVHVNRPADLEDFQLSLHRFGFAPSFKFYDKQGREMLNATLNLALADGREDSFVIPDTDYEVRARFFPDFSREPGRIVSKTPVPKNPVFLLELLQQGKAAGKGLIFLGKTQTIGDLTIVFDGLNYWVDLIVSRDCGLWVFAASFGLIVMGLTLRFAAPDKQLTASIADGTIEIKGWCKYFPTFFEEEMERLLVNIKAK